MSLFAFAGEGDAVGVVGELEDGGESAVVAALRRHGHVDGHVLALLGHLLPPLGVEVYHHHLSSQSATSSRFSTSELAEEYERMSSIRFIMAFMAFSKS